MNRTPRCFKKSALRRRARTTERRLLVEALEPRQLLTVPSPWNDFKSIALFFNLLPESKSGLTADSGYEDLDSSKVTKWLREDDTIPTTSEFIRRYWSALSYGNFWFHVDANRDSRGFEIPELNPTNPYDWQAIAQSIVRLDPQGLWRQAGSIVDGRTRVIPSVVLVQNYAVDATAQLQVDWRFTFRGNKYRVDDVHHIGYSVALNEFGFPATWGTLAHEYSHNFLESEDLYNGSGGKISSWDILGSQASPGRMSETSSFFKDRSGWITSSDDGVADPQLRILRGPFMAPESFRLQPYSSTGQAMKIVPDPVDNPGEYFLLEFRKSTGDSAWTPDANPPESGLLITHVNEVNGQVVTPLMDIEEADGNDGKCWELGRTEASRSLCDTEFTDHVDGSVTGQPGESVYDKNNWPGQAPGALFPFGEFNSFTPTTRPNSNFYGDRPSGLHITDIHREGNEMVFSVEMRGNNQHRFEIASHGFPRAADFTGDGKDEVLFFTGRELVIAEVVQNQPHVIWRARGTYEGTTFDSCPALGPRESCSGRDLGYGSDDGPIETVYAIGHPLGLSTHVTVGDYNGDHRSDVFLHDDGWATLLLGDGAGLSLVWSVEESLGTRLLTASDSAYAGDFDGDGSDDILLHSARSIRVFTSTGEGFSQLWRNDARVASAERLSIGDFNGDGRDDIFLTGDSRRVRLLLSTGTAFRETWSANRSILGGWRIDEGDRYFVGDFNGDGRDDIFVRGNRTAALLGSLLDGFVTTWIARNTIANRRPGMPDWNLRPRDEHYIGDLNGDGMSDIVILGSGQIGTLVSNGSELQVEAIGEEVGPWSFASKNGHQYAAVGRFNLDAYDDIFLYRQGASALLLGYLYRNGAPPYTPDAFGLQNGWISNHAIDAEGNWVDGWIASKGPIVPPDRFLLGNFAGNRLDVGNPFDPSDDRLRDDGRTDVLVWNGRELALFWNNNGNFLRLWQSGEWVGDWHLGPFDRLSKGDFNGDDREDIFIRSPHYAALFLNRGTGFENVWMVSDRLGDWQLGPLDREVVGDFTGDGLDDIFIRSPHYAALFRATGAGFENVWMTGDPALGRDFVGRWRLGPQDEETVGNLDADANLEIFVRNERRAGILNWDGSRFRTTWTSSSTSGATLAPPDTIDGWQLNPRDKTIIDDFLGGNDGIYIQNGTRAALFSVPSAGPDIVWSASGSIGDGFSGATPWNLGIADRVLAGELSDTGNMDLWSFRPQSGTALPATGILTATSGDFVGDPDGFATAYVSSWNIDTWPLDVFDSFQVGNFCGSTGDEIFVSHAGGWTGVFDPAERLTQYLPNPPRLGVINPIGVSRTHAHYRQLTANFAANPKGVTNGFCPGVSPPPDIYPINPYPILILPGGDIVTPKSGSIYPADAIGLRNSPIVLTSKFSDSIHLGDSTRNLNRNDLAVQSPSIGMSQSEIPNSRHREAMTGDGFPSVAAGRSPAPTREALLDAIDQVFESWDEPSFLLSSLAGLASPTEPGVSSFSLSSTRLRHSLRV